MHAHIPLPFLLFCSVSTKATTKKKTPKPNKPSQPPKNLKLHIATFLVNVANQTSAGIPASVDYYNSFVSGVLW